MVVALASMSYSYGIAATIAKSMKLPFVSGASLQRLILLFGQPFSAADDSHGCKKALQSV